MFFQTATIAAATWIAVGKNRHMADFAGHSHKAMENLSIDDDAAAYPGPQGNQNQIFYIFTGAHPLFAKRRGVGIILEQDGRAEMTLNLITHGKALKSWKIGRAHDNAGINIDKTGYPDSHTNQIIGA
jgi:hypothetical protein